MAVFRYFPVNGKVPIFEGWREAATDDQATLAKWTEQYRGKFTGWGLVTGPDTGLLVLDVDVKKHNGFESLSNFEVPTTLSQKTQSGGHHYIFNYPKDGHRYSNRVNFKPGLDIRADGGYIVVYDLDWRPLADPPPWLLEGARKREYEAPKGELAIISREVAEPIMKDCYAKVREAAAGEANDTLNTQSFRMGQLVTGRAVTIEGAQNWLLQAARERGKPDKESIATIHSGLKAGMSSPVVSPFQPVVVQGVPGVPMPESWVPKKLTREALLNTSKLRKPQLFSQWSTEDISITTADGGTGKTTLKLFEAIHLALGERFLGFDCKQRGKTLFITGEDTEEKIAALIGAIIKEMGFIDDDHKVQIILDSILIKKDPDLCLVTIDPRTRFLALNQDAVRKIEEAVVEFQPKMIVLDPISSFWGSESALNDMNRIVTKFAATLVERYGVCVEMINHMGKSSSQSKDMTQFAGRGGSGLPSNSRVSRVMRRVDEKEYKELTGDELHYTEDAIMCVVNKFTDGSPLYNKPFLILRKGYLFRRVDLAPKAQEQVKDGQDDAERIFMFIKEERNAGRYPTVGAVEFHFSMTSEPIAAARMKRAYAHLEYNGHLGEKIRRAENPDPTLKEKVWTVTDMTGVEVQ